MVADGRAMVTDDHQWFLGCTATSLRPVGRRDVAGSLLSVGDCRTAVFSSRRKVLLVFRWSQTTIDGDWSAIMIADCSRPVSDQLRPLVFNGRPQVCAYQAIFLRLSPTVADHRA